jgi:hypothetical protein
MESPRAAPNAEWRYPKALSSIRVGPWVSVRPKPDLALLSLRAINQSSRRAICLPHRSGAGLCMEKQHIVSERELPLLFPIFFVLMWLSVTTLLGFFSGWYALTKRYPDLSENATHTFTKQSGTMNLVGMRYVLNLGVCPSGLRVGIMRIFGIFCRDFFVPWNAIRLTRQDRLFWKVAKLSFGDPMVGSLTIPSRVADRVARAAGPLWPEVGPFPEETSTQALSRIIKQWAASTTFAAAFFIIVPRLAMPKGESAPPILVAVLFPAIVCGVVGLVQYLRRQRD